MRLQLKFHDFITGTAFARVSISHMDESLRNGMDDTTAPNGVMFSSVACPQWNRSILYLRGTSRVSDTKVLDIPQSDVPKLLEAVAWFNAQPEPADRKLKAFASELRTLADKYSK